MGQLKAGIVPVTPFQQNCTILFDDADKIGVVVDPGGDVDQILRAIEDNGLSIEAIWITHGHIDHAGGAMELKEALGVDIIGPHEADRAMLANLEVQAQRFGLSGRTDLPGGDHAALIASIKEKLLPLGDEVGFICGHGPGGRFGEERRTNPFLLGMA